MNMPKIEVVNYNSLNAIAGSAGPEGGTEELPPVSGADE